MLYVVAGLVLVAALCALNLVLTAAVIRRLRQHTEHISRLGSGHQGRLLPVGSTIPDFAATTLDGRTVSPLSRRAPLLVGYFSPGCAPCAEELPKFVARAAAMTGGSDSVLAIVVTDAPDAAADEVAQLRRVATVVTEPAGAAAGTAFGVVGYPTFYLLDDEHRVVAGGHSADVLPLPVRASV